MLTSLLSCLVFPTGMLMASQAPVSLDSEAGHQHLAFLDQGYNHTRSFSWGARRKPDAIRYRFRVADPHQMVHFRFWFAAGEGCLRTRLVGPQRQILSAQSGASGEVSLSGRVPKGICSLELDVRGSRGGRAEFAARGPIIPLVHPPPRSLPCPASPSKGFHWPYLLYRPKQAKHPCLLVAPNNTGFALEDPALLQAAGTHELREHAPMAEGLGCPLLVPLFPRPPTQDGNLYLHALSRESLLAQAPRIRRVDRQLLGMIEDARGRLRKQGLPIQPKVLLYGFSASGMFVNRFTLLHPDRVHAVACGSPGGWPMAPVTRWKGRPLTYPVGASDLETLTDRPLDEAALKSVAWFFFLGAKDRNDSTGERDSYSTRDGETVRRFFGPTPVSRWKEAERLYALQGLRAEFHLYPDVAHVVTARIRTDIRRFFESILAEASNPSTFPNPSAEPGAMHPTPP